VIAHLLHPPLLDEVGLASGLRLFLEGFGERSKIKVTLEIPHNFERLTQELETAIFRIMQECLTNIHRHSGSQVAKICITRRDGQVRVEVADRGRGIPPKKQKAMDSGGTVGVGIRGMRERVRQMGGTLSAIRTLFPAKCTPTSVCIVREEGRFCLHYEVIQR